MTFPTISMRCGWTNKWSIPADITRMPVRSLEQAQRNKLDHICRKLRLKPGGQILVSKRMPYANPVPLTRCDLYQQPR